MEVWKLDEIIFLEDDFFNKLNTEEAYHLEAKHFDDFWQVLSQQVSTQVVNQFGIGRLLDLGRLGDSDSYSIGGSVSTVHNAENDVFVSSEYSSRYNASYDRRNYEGRKISETLDTRMSVTRKKDFQQQPEIYDGYTGKVLPKTGQAHLDHVVSAKRIHDNKKARLFLSDDERNDLAMNENNLTYTHSSLNQSKGAESLSDWRQTTQKKQDKNNEERFEVKAELADKVEARAEKFVNVRINQAQLQELRQASIKQGLTQMKRQLAGLVLYKLSDVFIAEMQALIQQWDSFRTMEDRIDYFKNRMQVIKENVLESLHHIKDEFIGTSLSGFTSGVVGVLITTLMNSFVTTSARLGRLIQEGISSIISGFKLLVTNPDKLEKSVLIEEVIKLIGVGISVSIGLILTDLVDKKLSTFLPKEIANPVATVIGAMFTGSMSAVIIHLVDNFHEVIREVNVHWRNINAHFTISKPEIIETYNEAIAKIDHEYQGLLQTIALKYQELDRLSDLAFDIESMANVQFEHSIQYVKKMQVEPTKLLQTEGDIESFFLS
ncbi:hypothetical protein ACTQ45_11435 [Fundicoccus sp. Sow4_D5]|uniref:hypothetical protein n=1 Tax=unclassified Fundicoccus TaxID=2761543 RepID=UPI003F9225B7